MDAAEGLLRAAADREANAEQRAQQAAVRVEALQKALGLANQDILLQQRQVRQGGRKGREGREGRWDRIG